ncbi:MAG: archease [Chloroflexi bacterium]|jgi:SHS2 domain-containing protein|nr:archease [Chloroflexota bacterium]
MGPREPPQAGDSRYTYFDHEADVGLIGRGASLEAAFEAAARGLFALMVDVAAVQPRQHVAFTFQESDPELALVEWLNRLLAEARTRRLVFGRFQLRRHGERWEGEAWGEPWRPGLEPGVEVKGATLTMLAVRQDAQGWEARCVVDV